MEGSYSALWDKFPEISQIEEKFTLETGLEASTLREPIVIVRRRLKCIGREKDIPAVKEAVAKCLNVLHKNKMKLMNSEGRVGRVERNPAIVTFPAKIISKAKTSGAGRCDSRQKSCAEKV